MNYFKRLALYGTCYDGKMAMLFMLSEQMRHQECNPTLATAMHLITDVTTGRNLMK